MWAGVLSLISLVWTGIQTIADYAIIALTYAFNVLKGFAGAIWSAARFTWSNILKPVGEWLHKAYDHLKAIYDKYGAKVIKWARRITCAVRSVYDAYFRPILTTIDAVRRVLELLSLFHIQWAAQLDKALADLERKITKPILDIIQTVNFWVNRVESFVLTVDNLFVRATHLNTIRRDLAAIGNMHWNHSIATLTEKQKDGPVGMDDYIPVDETVQFGRDMFEGNTDATGINPDDIIAFATTLARTGSVSMWTSA